MDQIAALLSTLAVLGMVGWMVYSAIIYWRQRRLASFDLVAPAIVTLGLSFAARGEWTAAALSFALTMALTGWQQQRTQVELERKLNQQIRNLGIEGIYMTPFDP